MSQPLELVSPLGTPAPPAPQTSATAELKSQQASLYARALQARIVERVRREKRSLSSIAAEEFADFALVKAQAMSGARCALGLPAAKERPAILTKAEEYEQASMRG